MVPSVLVLKKIQCFDFPFGFSPFPHLFFHAPPSGYVKRLIGDLSFFFECALDPKLALF